MAAITKPDVGTHGFHIGVKYLHFVTMYLYTASVS